MDDSEDNLTLSNLEDTVSHSMKHATKKKKKRVRCSSNSEDNGYSDILAAVQELSNKQNDAFSKILTIETTIATTSKRIGKLSSTVEQLFLDVERHKELLKNTEQEIENRTLKAGITECKHYSWRWALKLHGLKDETNEDVRKCVINIFVKVAPVVHEYLEEGIDIAHPVGPKKPDGPHRSIIILFALRRIRAALRKNAKGCTFLRDNKLRITEALSSEDRSAREKLWSLVRKAREEGKKASFLGPFAQTTQTSFSSQHL